MAQRDPDAPVLFLDGLTQTGFSHGAGDGSGEHTLRPGRRSAMTRSLSTPFCRPSTVGTAAPVARRSSTAPAVSNDFQGHDGEVIGASREGRRRRVEERGLGDRDVCAF